MSSMLLKNGTALIHDADYHVQPTKTDILIQGNKIVKIEKDIKSEGSGVDIIDCTDKIISPGFIDTHHHVWQTQLKGRHADQLLGDYMITGNFISSQYQPSDIFWGELGGCLEALSAGTTTIVDHAHLNYYPESTRLALSATISSGIRSVFGYCPTPRVKSWNPLRMHENPLEDWILELMEELAKEAPWADGRVKLGLSYDLWPLGPEVAKSVLSKAKSLGITTITTHFGRDAQRPAASLPELLNSLGLLDSSILFSHATGCLEKDVKLIKEHDAKLSSTPSTELQMSMGRSICFDDRYPEMQAQSSLGIDCHSNNSGSIVQEMRLGLQNARNNRNERFLAQEKAPKSIYKTVEDAFNLGTIQGAKAIRMEKEIGTIAVGKLADLVVFDGLSPAMVCAAQHEPVAAIVLHSSVADIDTVIVDGKIRKKDGKLASIEVDKRANNVVGKKSLEWRDVASELLKSREEIQKKVDKLDMVDAKQAMTRTFGLDESKITDEP